MTDQAESLRTQLIQTTANRPKGKSIAIMSGKGGVGKSNVALNFAISLCHKGNKVLVVDLDIGMGNLDILMGETSKYTIADFFKGEADLRKMIESGPNGLQYIAGGTGLSELLALDDRLIEQFVYQLGEIVNQYDFVFFDMGAGVTADSAKFILAADEIIVVLTSEPTAMTDAYAAIKYIHLMDSQIPFQIVINRVESEKEGLDSYGRLSTVINKFLHRDIAYLGSISEDRAIQQAVKRQIPFIILNKNSHSARSIERIVGNYCRKSHSSSIHPNKKFITKLKQLLLGR
ncbi:MinD/ParA family protein [Cytobacillus horneckiae]|uniref:MinD/ParA family protein n=1 Tax=Cytobacillus horneckiae TaxID=549687 RepID=UPI00204227FA|nr:MinD/ParA family protein [Cytobacillus horneckiae]MCM3178226.1 MinD/ParA family protein [Cytobacillus horneckiae]